MENDKLAKVMEKIRKLLALAKSSNEHEAALAADRAQALLAEYNLTHADVEDNAQPVEEDDDTETDSYPWRRPLGTWVAKMFFCHYMYSTFKRRKTSYDRHIFVGRPHNIVVAKLMFEYLIATVERLARAGAKTIPLKQRSPYRVTFRTTCSSRLCARIADRINVAATSGVVIPDQTTRLPALRSQYEQAQAEIDSFLEPRLNEIKKVVQNTKVLHEQGSIDGHKAGGEIGLDQQVARKPAALLK